LIIDNLKKEKTNLKLIIDYLLFFLAVFRDEKKIAVNSSLHLRIASIPFRNNKGVRKPENINRSMEHGDGRLETEIITKEDGNRRMKAGSH